MILEAKQKIFAAAPPERYAAVIVGWGSPLSIFVDIRSQVTGVLAT
jgi:hypothetical protein